MYYIMQQNMITLLSVYVIVSKRGRQKSHKNNIIFVTIARICSHLFNFTFVLALFSLSYSDTSDIIR